RDPRCAAIYFTLFFFSSRRRHTRFSRDWSSDVCSSDLARAARPALLGREVVVRDHEEAQVVPLEQRGQLRGAEHLLDEALVLRKIGRASCRERVEIRVVAVSI